jgi:cytochrome c peroxidase
MTRPSRLLPRFLNTLLSLLAALLLPASALATGPGAGSFFLDLQLRSTLAREDVRPLRNRDFQQASDAKVLLGQMLFFDKEISGNRDISCATCHHPLAGTGDGLSLPAGVGGRGLSTSRGMGPDRERVPRNAPDVFNRGHLSFQRMFWDSRVEVDPSEPSGFRNPAGAELPPEVETLLGAQAMFPVTSAAEMRGNPGENEIANTTSNTEVWERLMVRLLAVTNPDGPDYRELFAAAFPDVAEADLSFAHAANAIGAFEAVAWRFDDSPFDRYLRGDNDAMSADAKRGALLFYGRAGCGDCHTGALQTDNEHHAVAMPQLGPGKGHGVDGDEDFGRAAVTGDPADMFAFRTPSLRNTELLGPWGHAGAYGTLEAMVRHQLRPRRSLRRYDRDQALPPLNPDPEPDVFAVLDDPAKVGAIAAANELAPTRLTRAEIDRLLDFLGALTDPAALDFRADVPLRVPSGLPLAD